MNYQEEKLAEIRTNIWQQLTLATAHSDAHFRYPSLLTQAVHFPQARTVVLRSVIERERSLSFYTHLFSPKIKQIQSYPKVGWHFYDHHKKEQIRMSGIATIVSDPGSVAPYWERVPLKNRKEYLTATIPGEELDHMGKDMLESEAEAPHAFAVVHTRIEFIDWLRLDRDIHQRAHFWWEEDSWAAKWVLA